MDAQKRFPEFVKAWKTFGQAKIVLKVEGEEQLTKFYQKAREVNLPCFLVVDAGQTEVETGTKTVVAIGPGGIKSEKEHG